MKTREELIESYNLLAEDYAREYCDELSRKPFDCELLERFVRSLPSDARVCDLGCGPGHLAEHLRSLGAHAFGVDLSPSMIAIAAKRYPSNEYLVGDMRQLKLPDEAVGGIVALYSMIHLGRQEVAPAVREMTRVLVPGGGLLVAVHRGKGTLHEDDALGHPVAFDCTLFEPEELSAAMEAAGLLLVDVSVREPYDFEYPTTRAYIWGKKP
jgi:SAM-dependent methyltransferase